MSASAPLSSSLRFSDAGNLERSLFPFLLQQRGGNQKDALGDRSHLSSFDKNQENGRCRPCPSSSPFFSSFFPASRRACTARFRLVEGTPGSIWSRSPPPFLL